MVQQPLNSTMDRLEHLTLLSDYNRWMNEKIYAAAQTLPAAELSLDRKAFFGSILGTLNHLAVADTVWLKRCADFPAGFTALAPLAQTPAPTRLDAVMFADLSQLAPYRRQLDDIIEALVQSLTQDHLDQTLIYKNMKGEEQRKNFHAVLLHCFNHHTHHRGQLSTLLFQAGVDVGVTDLLARVPNVL